MDLINPMHKYRIDLKAMAIVLFILLNCCSI